MDQQAYVDRQAEFNIDTSKGGNGKVVVDIDGPSECHVNCVEKGDGIFYCTYRATKPMQTYIRFWHRMFVSSLG